MTTKLQFYKPIIGMDVEFFLKQGRSVIGSEKVLKADNPKIHTERGSFVKDGVQIEINPHASYCREILGTSIAKCFQTFDEFLKENDGIKACFDECVTVPSREFKTLSDDSKRFGCDPDYNAHEGGKENIKVSGASTRIRTAGGHIHFGSDVDRTNFTILSGKKEYTLKCQYCIRDCKKYKDDNERYSFGDCKKGEINFWDLVNWDNLDDKKKTSFLKKSRYNETQIKTILESKIEIHFCGAQKTMINYMTLIPMIDLICGIPSVLIDRDPNVANRRKQYGRAGDYRFQPHGIEYRTLSNFWIKDFKLMHLFTGLARTAFLITSSDVNNKTDYCKQFWSMVDQKDVINAINNSDYRLARDVWLKIEPLLIKLGNTDTTHYPITSDTILGFKQFVLDGMDKHIGKNPIKNWVDTLQGSGRVAWETFAREYIKIDPNVETLFATTVKE